MKKLKQPINSRTDFFYYAFRNILLVGLPLIVVSILILFHSSSHSSADNSSSDNLTLSVPSSCTLNATINAEHFASIIGGIYKEGIGTTTIKAICNDLNGFSIYTIGASDNAEGNTKLISNISSQYDIVTGTATSGNISNWAMKLTPVSGTYTPNMEEGYNNQYVAVPNVWTKVASRPSNTDVSTDSNVAGSSLTTTYAAYVSTAQIAGTYNGEVKYLIIHPSNNQTILNTLEMAFDDVVGIENKTTYNGKEYYRMQDMNSEVCNATDIIGDGSQLQLLDDRTNLDGNKRIYWVTKLADGNCWMTQNLDLDIIAGHTYTHSDTDLGWNTTNFDVNATWTVGNDYGTISQNSADGKFTGWGSRYTIPYSGDLGEKYYYTSGTTNGDATFDSMAQCLEANHTQTDCEHYGVGNYYSWTAAIASNDSSSITGGNAPNSICPAGWRLSRASENEFTNLLVAYKVIPNVASTSYTTENNVKIGFNAIRANPLYFVRSGYVTDGGTLRYAASDGSYWSNTVSSQRYALHLFFNNNLISFTNYLGSYGRQLGLSIRCIARQS